ncbi:type II secretion system protein [Roseofilum sp. BLCC_M91]|uniref:Type II secretion system protein n=1 Tax=Roseofilum halophilum BLCC-M91 TaxID=3022259 RepID=A0ABT7BNG1_9CYAN|nr:type II secretion system protein [Roseofilum halophilum]MDJ1180307.1 type II secretion system protein [Roseofilum halophilum BLCC-M91]
MLESWRKEGGFTLIELLVVIALIAIVMAISLPSYLRFVRLQELKLAREELHLALKEAQSNAKRDKLVWQVSFRNNPHPQYAVHQRLPSGSDLTGLNWQDLNRNILIIDGKNQNETTFYQYTRGVNKGIWRMQFNHHGHPNGQLGRITVGFKDSDLQNKRRPLRCVIVSTLLGAMRRSHEQTKKENGKYCY